MPTQIEENEFLMRCACGDKVEHVAWLIHEPDDSRGNSIKGEQDDWYLMTALDRNFGFWRRLWTALRYALRPSSIRYFGYSELVLRNDDVERLADFIKARRTLRSHG